MEFTSSLNSKYATDVTLIERNRLRGWIAIIRENRGFIEQNNFTDKIEPIAFVNENLQVELGDEVEFSLRKHSNQLLAENILQVPSTIQNLYVSLRLNVMLIIRSFSRFFQQSIMAVLYHLFE